MDERPSSRHKTRIGVVWTRAKLLAWRFREKAACPYNEIRSPLRNGCEFSVMTRYLIGIDLGTTNSALAYIDLASGKAGSVTVPKIHPFAIPQLVAPAEVAPRPLLPSFLYLPGAHDLPAGATALPWNPHADYAVGEFARNHGAKIPGRLATSAKSWLCHAGVDRSAPLLPWSAPPDVGRVSPVEASARYLRHLVEGWNHVMAAGRPDDRLEKQAVVL